jgi:hypothetical protein
LKIKKKLKSNPNPLPPIEKLELDLVSIFKKKLESKISVTARLVIIGTYLFKKVITWN